MYKVIVSASQDFNNRALLEERLATVINDLNREDITLLVSFKRKQLIPKLGAFAVANNLNVICFSTETLPLAQQDLATSEWMAKEGNLCVIFNTGKKAPHRSLTDACKKWKKPVKILRA
jgi:hypothetical protein